MPITITYHASIEQKLSFGYSAAAESCWALECLANPEYHGQQIGWIVDAREQLPQGLHSRIVEFGSGGWRAAVELLEPASFAPFELELAQVRALDSRQLAARLAQYKHAEDSAGLRDQFCDLLDAFHPYFAATWSSLVEAFVQQVIELEGEHQSGASLPDLLASRTDQIQWNEQTDELTVATLSNQSIDAAKLDHVYIQPSYFAIPRMQLSLRGQTLAIWVPCPKALTLDKAPKVDHLVPTLRAIAGEARLKIVALLLERPRSTQELASVLHLAAPTVSRHLKQLSAAGLVNAGSRSERGKYVQYEANADAVGRLGGQLSEFFGVG